MPVDVWKNRSKRLALQAACCLLLGGAATPLFAHEGHDHDEAAQPASRSILPRFAAVADDFELVGVLAGTDLLLYLDDPRSNAPIDGASIELEALVAGAKAPLLQQAERVGLGTYRLPAGPLAGVGRHALTLTVSAGEASDLLLAELEILAPPHATETPNQADSRGWQLASHWWWFGAPLLLAAGGMSLYRRQQRRSSSRGASA